MATNPTIPPTQYYPDLASEVGPRTDIAVRMLYQKLYEHDQAFTSIKNQVDGKTVITPVTPTTPGGGSSGGGSGGGGTPSATLGNVNNQTDVVYIVQNSDYGGIVTFSNAAPIAVTLNSAVNLRWFAYLEALGAGIVTLTPDIGGSLINGLASLTVPVGSGAIVFFDGLNWWALTSNTIALQTNGTPNGNPNLLNLVAGTNVTITDSGTGNVTIASTGGGGGAPTMTSNANGVCADYGNGYVEQFGVSAAAATSVDRTSVAVTFPVPFAGVPVVVCSADNNPDGYGTAVFPVYPTSVTVFGFTANFTAGVTIGGGGPANITNLVHANWHAKYYP